MKYLKDPAIAQLRSLANQKYGIATFIGAGCSAALKIPLWLNMLSKLNMQFKFYTNDKELEDDITINGYAKVASNIKSRATDERLYKELMRQYTQPVACHFTSLHIELIRLSKLIVTTNYDESFEEAFKALGRFKAFPPMEFISSSLGSFSQKGWGLEQNIFHLHGDNNSEEYILTYESYKENYDDNHSGVSRLIGDIFSDFTTLFVGFSFEDTFFVNFLKDSFAKIKQEKSRYKKIFPKHYCIMSDNLIIDHLTYDELTAKKIDIDLCINKNILTEDKFSIPGSSIFQFDPNAYKNIHSTQELIEDESTFLLTKLKRIISNKDKVKLLSDLDIEPVFFEGDNYLQIEFILREINEGQTQTSPSFIPN